MAPPTPAPSRPSDATDGRFDAVILAGGRAQRLGGRDKPGVLVGGRTLAAAAVTAAAEATTVIVVGPRRPGLRRPPPGGILRFVREDPPGAGPVAALRCGMADVCAPRVAVLAADLPFMRAQVVRALLTAAAGNVNDHAREPAGAILVDDGGRPQWLIGCWWTGALQEALGAYRGRSLHGLLAPMRPALLAAHACPGEPPPWLDCDSPADLRLAREWADGSRRGGCG
jgi:molybdopterin-guanine dinucleotide biosynthesis protein A